MTQFIRVPTHKIHGFGTSHIIIDKSQADNAFKETLIELINSYVNIRFELKKFNRMKIILTDQPMRSSHGITGAGAYMVLEWAERGDFNIVIVVSDYKKRWEEGKEFFRNHLSLMLEETIKHEAQHNRDKFRNYFKVYAAKVNKSMTEALKRTYPRFIYLERTHNYLEWVEVWQNLRYELWQVVNSVYLEGMAIMYQNLSMERISFSDSIYMRIYSNAKSDTGLIINSFNGLIKYLKGEVARPPTPQLFAKTHSIGLLIVYEVMYRTGKTFDQVRKMTHKQLLRTYEHVAKYTPLFGLKNACFSYYGAVRKWKNVLQKNAKKMLQCPKCSKFVSLNAHFCGYCAYPLRRKLFGKGKLKHSIKIVKAIVPKNIRTDYKICFNCHKENPYYASFCGDCGHKLR